MKTITAYIKCILLLVSMFWHLAGYWVRGSWRRDHWPHAFRARRRWIRDAHKILNLKITFKGQIPASPAFFFSNHRSFVDPLIILRYINAFPVAKMEISKYPLVGMASRHTGIIFVDRKSSKSREETRNEIVRRFEDGHSVLIFPEGTVNDQPKTKAFSKGGFEKAGHLSARVVPVAIHYKNKAIFWSPNQSMWQHFLNLIQNKPVEVIVSFGTEMSENNSFTLLRECRRWIDEELNILSRDASEPTTSSSP